MVFSSFVCWFICLWNEKPEAQRRDLTRPRPQSMCKSHGSELWSPVLGLLLLAGRWLSKKHTHQSWGKASTEILKAFKNPAAWNLIEVMGGENFHLAAHARDTRITRTDEKHTRWCFCQASQGPKQTWLTPQYHPLAPGRVALHQVSPHPTNSVFSKR